MTKEDKRIAKEAAALIAQGNAIAEVLFNTLSGARRDEMSETLSEEFARIEAEETHPVIRADYKLRALRGLASDFGVAL